MLTPNSAYIEELYLEYLRDPNSVDENWRTYFSQFGTPDQSLPTREALEAIKQPRPVASSGMPSLSENGVASQSGSTVSANSPEPAVAESKNAPAQSKTSVVLGPNDRFELLPSLNARIAENMNNSLRMPKATSFREIPVKVLEENRRLLNRTLGQRRKNKLSFTHILAWGLVKALIKYPNLNDAYAEQDGKAGRVKRAGINIGLAVDTTRKDGSRVLVVPSVKNAQNLHFSEFCEQYDDLITKARNNKLSLDDLTGSTMSLTNPGTIGTIASVPRLMEGQGLIIATGSIDYPAEFAAVMPEVLSTLAISKVMTITSTYDHRIIQGAESGEFLQYLHKLLLGEERFYDQIFANLQIPFEPFRWSIDKGLSPFGPQDEKEKLDKEARVAQMIHSYRVRGHLLANVNPLGLQAYSYLELEPSNYGFTVWDLDREYDTGGIGGVNRAPLREIIEMLRDTYCGTIGIEYMHVTDPVKKDYIKQLIEPNRNTMKFGRDEKLHTYKNLLEAEAFEQYLQTKYLGAKRFSLEGGETTINFMDKLLELAATTHLKTVVLGMAHRGRLNVLANIMNKPLEKIFDEFEGNYDPDSFHGSGDVKYHLGAQGRYKSRTGDDVNVILAPNPSHLEAVDPVVVGMSRALMDLAGDTECRTVLPILVHGDAAFAGQGVVMETLNLSRLSGYRTGGTIHVIINNQIGFTTSPDDARSTTYATDVAKMLQVPIMHVNGDDPEAIRAAASLAFSYRQRFNEDVVVDIFCYRKYGHNEADEPSYTQPLLYKKIKAQTPVRQAYYSKLIGEKTASVEELEAYIQETKKELNEAFVDRTVDQEQWTPKNLNIGADVYKPVQTSVSDSVLRTISAKLTTTPEEFHANPKVTDLLSKRAKMLDSATPAIDWGFGEALAFGSLLLEGSNVRFSGQDSGRGTFSQRHAILYDYLTENDLVLLNQISDRQAKLYLYDSPLSEVAVLGFEYGYSVIATQGLTLWEAQFGDFVNGAQVVIDQFISSAEAKWGQISNLTLLLPHGYEGQGPEHSSARPERFLQLCAEENMFVCNLSTPAQYFHALRRQVRAPYRKPLVIMTPKALLRAPISKLSDLTDKNFEEVIDDTSIQSPESVNRVIFCSGKVYYDLVAERTRLAANDVAIVRLEQLYPFHEPKVKAILERYFRASSVMWVQEEPKNMGYWFFVAPRFRELLSINQRLTYVGRVESASPATGFSRKHDAERVDFLKAAFSA